MAGQRLILNEINTAAIALYARLAEGAQKDALWRRIFKVVLVRDKQGNLETKLCCNFCNALLSASNPSSSAQKHPPCCKVRMQPPMP